MPKSIDRGIQTLTTPERHVESTLGPKMTPQLALTPNHVKLEGVATGYRRVYLNVAFNDMNVERTSRRTGSTKVGPLVSHRHEAPRARFGLYLISTLGPCGGLNSFRLRCLVAIDGRMGTDGHRNANISCPKILRHDFFCVAVANGPRWSVAGLQNRFQTHS